MQYSTVWDKLRVLGLLALLGLSGCNENSSLGETGAVNSQGIAGTAAEVSFGGSVGDGPVTGATVNVVSANGETLATSVSNNRATYQATLRPTSEDYPIRLVVTGGTDLVTGRQPDFQMASVMLGSQETTVNINPFSTLVTRVAERLPGGLNRANISAAKDMVMNRLSFGLNGSSVPDPISTPVTTANVAQMVRASEALGEAIRRTRDLLRGAGQQTSGDAVMAALAADMTDGHPDGLGSRGSDPTVTAVFNVVRGQVLVELLSNSLRVAGVIAAGVIDQSISTTNPGISQNQLTGSVRVTADGLDETRIALAAASELDSGTAIAEIARVVDGISPGASAASVAGLLPSGSTLSLNTAVARVATASSSQIAAINQTVFALADGGTSTGSDGGGSVTATTGSFSLRWTAPSARTDGTPLSLAEIDGYRIYYGTSSGNYPYRVELTSSAATSTTIENLPAGSYYLVMTTYDNGGRESARSSEVIKHVL